MSTFMITVIDSPRVTSCSPQAAAFRPILRRTLVQACRVPVLSLRWDGTELFAVDGTADEEGRSHVFECIQGRWSCAGACSGRSSVRTIKYPGGLGRCPNTARDADDPSCRFECDRTIPNGQAQAPSTSSPPPCLGLPCDRKLRTMTCGTGSLAFCSMPIICLTSPPGLGTGHSLFGLPSLCIVSISPTDVASSVVVSGDRLRRRLIVPSGISMVSAYCRRSTGHGSKCGNATTRNETARVPVKRVPVVRERGWR